jgi:hypothetical protein
MKLSRKTQKKMDINSDLLCSWWEVLVSQFYLNCPIKTEQSQQFFMDLKTSGIENIQE